VAFHAALVIRPLQDRRRYQSCYFTPSAYIGLAIWQMILSPQCYLKRFKTCEFLSQNVLMLAKYLGYSDKGFLFGI